MSLARLNHEAGILSIKMNSYPSAIQYFTVVIEKFGDGLWKIERKRLLSAYENRAKSYTAVAKFDNAEQDVDLILQITNQGVDRYQIAETAIKLYTSSYQIKKGIDFGIQYLRDSGLDIPEQLDHKYGEQLLNLVNQYLEKSVDFFYQLPHMTDIKMQSAGIVLYHLDKLFLINKPELRYIIPCLIIDLCVKYGQHSALPAGLAAYASAICHLDIKHYKKVLYATSIAEKLCYRQSNKEFLPYVLKIRYGHFSCLDHSHTYYINKLDEGFHVARERGDNQMASYCYNIKLLHLFVSGIRLTEVIKTGSEMQEAIDSLGDKYATLFSKSILRMLQRLKNVNCESDSDSLQSQNTESNFSYFFSLIEMITEFFYHNHQSACKRADTITKQIERYNMSPNLMICLSFYGALSFLSLAKHTHSIKKQNYLKKAHKFMNILRDYQKNIPESYDNKYRLVKAELSTVEGKYADAMDLYEMAIKQSNTKKLIHDEALCYELAAEFYILYDKKISAKLYLQTAYKLYTKWEAYGKAKDLEKRFPDDILKEKQSDSDTSTLLDNIDLKTILRTTKTIALESSANRQFEMITKYFAESSGAQKGILLLNINKNWNVESIINIHSNTDFCVDCMNNDYVNAVPLSMINYVSHSKKEVILDDATESGDFKKDPYIVNSQVKSILCLPLLNKGNVNGIIYLENKTISYLFTKKICKVFKAISVQLSLLIENYIMGQYPGNLDPINTTQQPLNGLHATHSNGYDVTPNNHPSGIQNSIQLNNNNETKAFHKSENNEQPEFFKKYKISAKELEIIHFVRDGLTSKEISDEMNLSVETISTYRKRIRKKFGITNKRTSLAFFINNKSL